MNQTYLSAYIESRYPQEKDYQIVDIVIVTVAFFMIFGGILYLLSKKDK